MENGENKDLQGRREFFKEAAKKALPILGAVALMGNPVIAKAVEMESTSCERGCTYTCKDDCTAGCRGGCKSGCRTSCSEGCKGQSSAYGDSSSCRDCQNYCFGCQGYCQGTCKGSCASTSSY